METNLLYYHPMNSEGIVDLNNALSCSLLKYHLDPYTEYEDISDKNKLIDRENNIINYIKAVDSSIIELTGFNVLHNSFFLQ